jgi:hypothetical protein
MKIKVQPVVCDDDGHEEKVTDVVVLKKACQQIEQVGLTLAEAKSLLSMLVGGHTYNIEPNRNLACSVSAGADNE